MGTQWRVVTVGMGGALYEGLIYEALREVWMGCRVKKKDRPEIFSGLRVMEEAAKRVLNAKKG